MTDLRIVWTTLPDLETARAIVHKLVDERLIACGNIVPGVTSIYRWNGEIQEESEQMVMMKLRVEDFEALRRRLVELHPYEVPEIVGVRADRVHPDYARWVQDSTQT